MSRFTRLVVVTLAALLIVGCGKDSPLTGTGQEGIEVTGYLTSSLIHTTSDGPLSDDTPVQLRIIGLPGAATQVTEVKATNQRSGESNSGAVAADGSFELALMVLRSDSISIAPVGVATEETVDIQINDISPFPNLSEGGQEIEYGMEYLDECEPFADEESGSEPGPEEDEEWEHDWTEEDLSPEQEEDCQVALVQVFLAEPLPEGKLLLLNPDLDIVKAMESENQQVWYGVIRAFPEQVLWLVHELDDGSWSEFYSIAVP